MFWVIFTQKRNGQNKQKSPNLFGQTKIMQPLWTKKSHITFLDKGTKRQRDNTGTKEQWDNTGTNEQRNIGTKEQGNKVTKEQRNKGI